MQRLNCSASVMLQPRSEQREPKLPQLPSGLRVARGFRKDRHDTSRARRRANRASRVLVRQEKPLQRFHKLLGEVARVTAARELDAEIRDELRARFHALN